jgi:hypothetical protein
MRFARLKRTKIAKKTAAPTAINLYQLPLAQPLS